MSEIEPARLEILRSNVSSYFEKLQEQLGAPARRGRAEEIFNSFSNDEEQSIRHGFDGFINSKYNSLGLVADNFDSVKSLIKDQIEIMIESIKKETEENFRKYFERVYYYNVGPSTARSMSMPERETSITADGLVSFVQQNRENAEAAELLGWQKPMPTNDNNVYGLSLKNLDFLKPILTELIDKLLVDHKGKAST